MNLPLLMFLTLFFSSLSQWAFYFLIDWLIDWFWPHHMAFRVLRPLQWNLGVLTTGPPGKSPHSEHFMKYILYILTLFLATCSLVSSLQLDFHPSFLLELLWLSKSEVTLNVIFWPQYLKQFPFFFFMFIDVIVKQNLSKSY